MIRLTQNELAARDAIIKKMTSEIYRLEANPCLCGKTEGVVVARKDRYDIPLTTVLCSACGLMRTDPYYTDAALALFYKNDYRKLYTGNEKATEKFFFEQRTFGREIRAFLANGVFHTEVRGKKVFEIGCGAGGILEAFRESGNEVFGCDYGEDYVEFGVQNGLKLVSGDSETLKQFGTADIVILNHTLEHMTHPRDELLNIRKLLSSNGILYIALPGIYYIHDTYRGHLAGSFLQNAHVWHFTLKTLNQILADAGFALIAGNEIIKAAFRKSDISEKSQPENPEDVLSYLKKIGRWRWYYGLKKFSLRHTAFETLRKIQPLYRVTRNVYRKFKKRT